MLLLFHLQATLAARPELHESCTKVCSQSRAEPSPCRYSHPALSSQLPSQARLHHQSQKLLELKQIHGYVRMEPWVDIEKIHL